MGGKRSRKKPNRAPRAPAPESTPLPQIPPTPPEEVHWTLTHRCLHECADSPAARRQDAPELPTSQARSVIERVADWGTSQLSIGGGEPLLREDLPALVRHARDRGLSVSVTTRGDAPGGLTTSLLQAMSCLRIDVDHGRLIEDPEGEGRLLAMLCRRASAHDCEIAANLVFCRTVIEHLDELIARLSSAGFPAVVLLRYRPPASLERWEAEAPEPKLLLESVPRLVHVIERHAPLQFQLDCALALLALRLPTGSIRGNDQPGCPAATRTLALGPDGGVYPCPHLAAPALWAGNILHHDLADLWHPSKSLVGYRSRRDSKRFLDTICGICRAAESCGGCPAMAHDAMGADPGCPQPLLPPLHELGRRGRAVELHEYLSTRSGITVREYMDRYGIGQRRAVSELRRFPGLNLAVPDYPTKAERSGRRLIDRYERTSYDLIGEVQSMIGCTSGGFPYARREEVMKWLGLDARQAGYPHWLVTPQKLWTPPHQRSQQAIS